MTSSPILIDYTQYINNRIKKTNFLYVRDIKHTLKHYNQNPKGKKTELLERLDNIFTKIKSMEKYNKEIIMIQKMIRGYLVRKNIKNKPYFFRNRCTNTEDFYTFESIDYIDPLYFFSYTDNDKFIYFFDIRSFEKLIKNNHNNPYNRQTIPSSAIQLFNETINIVKNNKEFIPFETPKITDVQKYRNRVVEIFQKIDATDCIAGGTNVEWFLNLKYNNKLRFYTLLEDIWSYRANLSIIQKEQIVPGRNIFNRKEYEILFKNRFKNKYKILINNFILDNIDKLVSSADENIHRATGAYYILISLVQVSPSCAAALPWLVQ